MLEIPGYTIKNKLGVGGMAVVYLATQDSLGRDVALKVMVESEQTERNHKERFIHEGHDLASLQHPNIVTIHDISHSGEHIYYAMELLKYGSLKKRLKEGRSLREAFNIVLQIGSALECAHQNNIIHRDLKPDNILFRDPSTPILADFGIAKNTDRETHLTKSGELLGTPSYMSPEQCRGFNVNARSDQYSLCVLFYEMITGYLPFDANESIAIAMKHINDPIPRLPKHFEMLQWFVDIALDKEPQNRFTSVGEFCRVLKDILDKDSSLQAQLDNIIYRSPMDSDTIIREESFESLDSESSGFDSLNSLDGGTLDSLPLPTEDEFWNKGGILTNWLLIFLLLAGIGYGGHYYYVNYFPSKTASSNERNISLLLKKAEKQVALSQLMVPKGNNAFETLTEILTIAPNNQLAIKLMEEAATSYEVRAKKYIERKEYDKAQRQIKRGFNFSRNHKGLKNVQASLDKIRQK